MASNHSQNLNLFGVLSESKRIINAHSRHFLALSVVFLIPLSFSLLIYPILHNTFFHNSDSIQSLFISISLPENNLDPTRIQFLLPLLYAVFVVLLAIFAVATITYSTFHGFYGRPVKLVSSFKSTLYSFLPLLVTFLVSQIILSFCAVLFAVLGGMVYKSLKLSGIQIEPGSNLFLGCCILAGVVAGSVLIAIQLNFSLGFVVVVVESKWGLEPLRRSAYLLKGMKAVALAMLVFYGLAIGFLAWECSTTVAYSGRATGLWSWAFVLQTVASSGFITLLMLHNVAANVVLYMYCKALRGELAFDTAEEFACEYFSLPYDYEKVPHVVSVFHE